jgi:hypothetical protein
MIFNRKLSVYRVFQKSCWKIKISAEKFKNILANISLEGSPPAL